MQIIRGHKWIPGRIASLIRMVAVILAIMAATGLGDVRCAGAVPPVKKVLLVYPTSIAYPFYSDFTGGFKERLRAETSLRVEFSHESVDLLRFAEDDALAQAIAEVFRRKYQNARPDLIVTHADHGFAFLKGYCADVFGDTPVITFYTRPVDVDAAAAPANYSFCYPTLDAAKNVELILALRPSVRQVYVVIGDGGSERKVREELPRQLAPFAGRVEITYLNRLSLEELLARTSAIGGQAAILFVEFVQDAAGRVHVPAQVVRRIAAEAQVPVFACYSTHLGQGGAVGGHVLNMRLLGREVGGKAAATLKGEAPLGKIVTLDIEEYRFDQAELARWGIRRDELPPGSVVINRPPSLWEEYKWQMAAAGSLAVSLVSVLAALVMFHRRRLRAAETKVALGAGLIDEQQEVIRERTSELRETEGRFRHIFENSPVMIVIVNMADTRFLEANQKFLATVEYTRGEVVGSTPGELGLWANDAATAKALLAELGKKGEYHNAEVRLTSKTGKIITALMSSVLIAFSGEQCRLTTMQDITEGRRLEAELMRLDRLNLVGEMAAGIGHEIRNPMTTVRGYLQMFQQRDEYSRHKEQFATMIEELDRANANISEYLALAKTKLTDLKRGNLNETLNALFPLMQADALRSGRTMELSAGLLPDIDFDEKELRQLVLNLVRNGLEASPEGGAVTVTTNWDGDGVVLAVRDTGGGIPKEVADKIGTPFLTTKASGTGLGLSVCFRIAQRHDAKIEFTTGKKGTTFYVRFPVP